MCATLALVARPAARFANHPPPAGWHPWGGRVMHDAGMCRRLALAAVVALALVVVVVALVVDEARAPMGEERGRWEEGRYP